MWFTEYRNTGYLLSVNKTEILPYDCIKDTRKITHTIMIHT